MSDDPSVDHFSTDPAGLAASVPPEIVALSDGEEFELGIAPVAKRLGDTTVRMLAYNGSVPGPVLRVREGSELVVNVLNEVDIETTVHWHGLRLDNRYDGTHLTQEPIRPGDRFTYRITFPDPGIYWYHPHVREDYSQEMGLSGTIVVAPSDPDYWPPADREIALTLDDVLIEGGRIAPFSRTETTYAAMGRFGNVLLANGEQELPLAARQGEVVRLYLANTANTRVFNIGVPGARMKLVGGDSGRYERESLVEAVLLSPSERAVVDVLFEQPGMATLEHRTPQRTYPLAVITVSGEMTGGTTGAHFDALRTAPELLAERERITPHLDREPDRVLALVAEMDMGEPDLPPGAEVVYVCPMHPEVLSNEPGRCPKCGMKLMATEAVPPGEVEGPHDHHHDHAAAESTADGIEWEDDMVEMNRMSTPSNMRWKLVDRLTAAEGPAIDWQFRVGDQVKIQLVNEMDSDHPMHHPVHIHGAGRFLILSRDGTVEPNLVWKDTALVPTGQTVDILLDVTNPGVWMVHCHIAEHHESGMRFSFNVDP